MSIFGDYKSYKKYSPLYPQWKFTQDLNEARRVEYLKRNPSEMNKQDIQKSKALLRTIDVMDEYSQKRAEDMETATETVVGLGMELAMSAGAGIGYIVSTLKPFQNLFKKYASTDKKVQLYSAIVGVASGVIAGTAAAFPLYAWAARAEVNASRKGRFEAMRKDLQNPKTFAVLNDEQETKLKELLVSSPKKKNKNPARGIKDYWTSIKNGVIDSDEYLLQRMEFEKKLEEDNNLHENELSPKEIEDAKRDQQLLTKLVDKIDIASQDYAENAELATSALITTVSGFSVLFSLGYEKLAAKLKWKSSIIPSVLSTIAMLASSIFAASIQKEASRVGRFKAKQNFLNNPEQLVYVSDEKTGNITDVEVKPYQKTGIIKFLKEAYKNQKEYTKWKQITGEKEKNLAKALEKLEISDAQIKEAKRLQHNTFKTFNKVDENSQKYSESIEALGQALQFPITFICSMIGAGIGAKFLLQGTKSQDSAKYLSCIMKYLMACLVSTLPAIGINAYITKEQKKASRVANMLSINELSDYRHFVDYSRFKNS